MRRHDGHASISVLACTAMAVLFVTSPHTAQAQSEPAATAGEVLAGEFSAWLSIGPGDSVTVRGAAYENGRVFANESPVQGRMMDEHRVKLQSSRPCASAACSSVN